MDAIFQNVWEVSLFAIPVILVFALCSKTLGKRYGAKWRYLLWLVIVVRLCIPVQITLPEPMMGMQMEVPSVQNGAMRNLLFACADNRFVDINPSGDFRYALARSIFRIADRYMLRHERDFYHIEPCERHIEAAKQLYRVLQPQNISLKQKIQPFDELNLDIICEDQALRR